MTRKRDRGYSLQVARPTPVVSRGSNRVPATFMSALPQTRHKHGPSAVVDGFLCANVERGPYSPRDAERAKEERTEARKKKREKRRKKSALGPGGRAKSTRSLYLSLSFKPQPSRSAFNKCIGVKKKKRETRPGHYRWNWESIAREGMGLERSSLVLRTILHLLPHTRVDACRSFLLYSPFTRVQDNSIVAYRV